MLSGLNQEKNASVLGNYHHNHIGDLMTLDIKLGLNF